jgi:four helix bundle protein
MQQNYKNLIVWQKSIELVIAVYELTEKYPKSELYGLTSQSRRCSVSIPSNIAEGRRRSGDKEFYHFLSIAFGSGAELETQIEIAKRLPFGKGLDFKKCDDLLEEVMKMLNSLLQNKDIK